MQGMCLASRDYFLSKCMSYMCASQSYYIHINITSSTSSVYFKMWWSDSVDGHDLRNEACCRNQPVEIKVCVWDAIYFNSKHYFSCRDMRGIWAWLNFGYKETIAAYQWFKAVIPTQ